MILDTNVLSEMMRGDPDGTVSRWLDAHAVEEFAIAAITVQEISYGIERMPAGRRRENLEGAWHRIWRYLALGVHPFDAQTALLAAQLMALRERAGRRLGTADAQIAATARVHRTNLATRNVKDFDGLGLELINPWE